eukprot:g6850.t1
MRHRNCFKSEEPADPPEDLTEQPPDGLESEERLAAMIQRIFPVERDNDEYRARHGKRQLLCLQWNSVLGFFLRLWNFVAVGISLGSLLVILRVWQQEKLELLNGDVKIALSELEEVRREMAAFNEKIKITTKDVEEEEGEDQSTAVEPTAMSRALTVRTRPALLGRGVVDACFDVATTGLALECHSMSASHCQRGASAEAIRAMCPKSCNVSDCRGAASCRDLDFTTFQEEDGSMSSCRLGIWRTSTSHLPFDLWCLPRCPAVDAISL